MIVALEKAFCVESRGRVEKSAVNLQWASLGGFRPLYLLRFKSRYPITNAYLILRMILIV